MKPSLHRFYDSTLQRFNGFTVLVCALFLSLSARAQSSAPGEISLTSISGQFIVSGALEISPLARLTSISENTNLLRLQPALLVVAAERIKESLWHALEIGAKSPWSGSIYLMLHPAQSPDENAILLSQPSGDGWKYGVQLPDVVTRQRFAHALTGILLLEFANRNAQSHSAEIPVWLADGLAEQLFPAGSPEIFLSAPAKIINDLSVARTDTTRRGLDPLAGARETLKNYSALTFEQLSWPTAVQLAGDDDGVYCASAQLLVSDLLKLRDGPAQLRAMLVSLPRYYNWQTAFLSAFHENFSSPLAMEKWWALQIVTFAARDPGPRWTPAVSCGKLDEILGVPVEMRDSSNSLPVHAEVSLQAVIRNFDSARQGEILQTKLRDLELAQLRMASPLAALTDDYHRALADYLGQRDGTVPTARLAKHPSAAPKKSDARDTLAALDSLDARRRVVESSVKPDFSP
jgi:hypothetical protein